MTVIEDNSGNPSDVQIEKQTVTASSGSVTVSFDGDYSEKPVVQAVADYSGEQGVTIDSTSTYDDSEVTLLCEKDTDIHVLVIGK